MSRPWKFTCAGLLMVAAPFPSACSDDGTEYVEPAIGSVEFSWTIDDDTDPDGCEEVGAEAFEVVLIDEGFYARQYEIPCEDFSGTIEIVADDYIAQMTLIDSLGVPVTERLVSSSFTVTQDEEEQVEVDFPPPSFED